MGWLLGHRFVLINHVGRTSGREYQVVVEVVAYDPANGTVTVASGFGPGADWYRNLLAHPDVTVQIGTQRCATRAVALPVDEGGRVMVDYASRHPLAARGLARFMGFRLDGSPADYEAMGRQIPFLHLRPARRGERP